MCEYLDENGRFDVARWAVWAERNGYLPWQMTLKEYSAFLDKDKPTFAERAQNSSYGLYGLAIAEAERLSIKKSSLEAHRRSVDHALSAGKAVRPEVLADYGLCMPQAITGSGASCSLS